LGSLSQLFFDNLSTLLGALFAVQGLTNEGEISVSQATMDEYVWGKIVPGVGITLVIGNLYYSWQAIRLTNKHGRQYTAQPYGLNTPAAFAFVFNIIYTVFFISGGDPTTTLQEKEVGGSLPCCDDYATLRPDKGLLRNRKLFEGRVG